MIIPERVELRPHHILIFLEEKKDDDYEAWGEYMNFHHGEDCSTNSFPESGIYTKRTIRRMVNFFRDLSRIPNTQVEVVTYKPGGDYLCGLCNNLIGGECEFEKGDTTDKEAMFKYNLSIDEIISVQELFLRRLAFLREF